MRWRSTCCCWSAILSMLQATLTLPGIAAIALTLGMAIDANVPHQRAHPRGAALGRDAARGAAGGLRARMGHDSRLEHHDADRRASRS
jgi:hypothetical protein